MPQVIPELPGGQWVGLSGVAVSIPGTWQPADVEYRGHCDLERFDLALTPSRPTGVVCFEDQNDPESNLVIVGVEAGAVFVGGRRLDLGFKSVGMKGLQTDIRCRGELCDVTFAASTVLIGFSDRGPDARQVINQVRESLSSVPDGYVAVPPIRYGTSVDDALEILSDSGLSADKPDVNFPHYFTATEPEAGTILEVGSKLEIGIGDG